MEEDINNLSEIINLCKEEIESSNENTTAILDLQDLKSLKNILVRYKELEEENNRKNIEPVIINNKMYFINNELYKDLLKDIKTNYISISVIQNKKKEEREKCVARFRYGNDEAPSESYKYKYTDIDMNEYAGSEIMRVLQELLEEGRK